MSEPVTAKGKLMTEAGFKITRGKGFHLTFENGWMVSVQFGPCSYIMRNRYPDIRDFSPGAEIRYGAEGSLDAEVMVFPPGGLPYEEENPIGYQTPDQVAAIIEKIVRMPCK